MRIAILLRPLAFAFVRIVGDVVAAGGWPDGLGAGRVAWIEVRNAAAGFSVVSFPLHSWAQCIGERDSFSFFRSSFSFGVAAERCQASLNLPSRAHRLYGGHTARKASFCCRCASISIHFAKTLRRDAPAGKGTTDAGLFRKGGRSLELALAPKRCEGRETMANISQYDTVSTQFAAEGRKVFNRPAGRQALAA